MKTDTIETTCSSIFPESPPSIVPSVSSGFASTAGTPDETAGHCPSMASSVTRHAQNPLSDNYQLLVSGIDSLDLGLYIQWNHTWPDFRAYLDQKKQAAMNKNGVLDQTATGDLKEPFSWLLGFVSSSAHPFSS